MRLSQALRSYIGSDVEVFQSNQFLEGRLIDSQEDYIIVKVSHPGYTQPFINVTVAERNVGFIRVLK
ncbi:hypothetical protein ABNB59_05400 [Paenibacillus larvae]|uniref:Uncharacterized protein n=3 Tax=Paenibacillus larvae TaxID=1464 RepID=A0A2L1TMW3_9BACL|nr:hypothetical protein [Paenibacillus larvae]AQR77064.1 hypothetical protein BXP28_06540 [Paenibacillus larvae subsp. larvae]AQT86558.1 hypothetical protein B1222_22715 [Paenibacillus larvae subsp. pulvifaciens]AQZ48233.1 hypothetical protein B5S25_18275 [Paenibacillus larvae subsp. pulvifaciens]ARF66647.1 hypothetical protein B7C51_00775 [Paenibacillus larvae subsp. pulvifaciens]AVF21998.1 hypothetical protein ERICI_02143 [Paenibacillus larvae subsp. larvae]